MSRKEPGSETNRTSADDDTTPPFATSFIIAMIFIGLLLGGLAVALLTKSVMASGGIDYCYVAVDTEPDLPVYTLRGHRPYRLDRSLGVFPSLGEAMTAASALQCPLR